MLKLEYFFRDNKYPTEFNQDHQLCPQSTMNAKVIELLQWKNNTKVQKMELYHIKLY